ncbi:MAG TPA: DUF4142 domain-containing protein [Actinomycetota bacterium]|nr:DUF4142 domain-containing protein [Actinomycetota bacterium]
MKKRLVATITGTLLAAGMTLAAVAAHGADREPASESRADLNAMDKEFLKSAAAGARFEVIGGHHAVKLAASAKVTHFGHRMIKDHSLEFQKVLTEARHEHVVVPPEPEPEQKKTLKIAGMFKGHTFDCAYMALEYTDHTADVAEAELELAEGHDGSVKDLAAWTLHNIYRPHLAMASDILMSLNCS